MAIAGAAPVGMSSKAWKLGINYFDTSNGYGFRARGTTDERSGSSNALAPGQAGYDEKLRRSM